MLTRELSPGCHLRLLEERDADELYTLVAANHEHLARWLPWVEGHTPERSLEFIRATRQSLGASAGMTTAVVVDGAIAGVVGLHEISWMHRSTSAGYWLAEGHQGRGLVTAAVAAYVDHAFGTLGLHRFEIRAAVDNARSRAIPERLGFTQEGTLRGAERVGGRMLDLVVYSRLAVDHPRS
jgi:ribosomal-protein-serine acetyltransferase